MATLTAYFIDGPCKGKPRKITFEDHPPGTLSCGGSVYVYSGQEVTTTGGESTGALFYAVSGGPYDNSVERIKGERDVYRAWSNLRSAMRQTTGIEVRRVRTARRRIRRAVR